MQYEGQAEGQDQVEARLQGLDGPEETALQAGHRLADAVLRGRIQDDDADLVRRAAGAQDRGLARDERDDLAARQAAVANAEQVVRDGLEIDLHVVRR